jgi:hypothetical protein
MLLSDLPNDVFQPILDLIKTRDILALFFTGNRRIQAAVGENTTQIVLESATDLTPPGIYEVVSQLPRLKSISFHNALWRYAVNGDRITPAFLQSIRAPITSLELPFRNLGVGVVKALPPSLTFLSLPIDRTLHSKLVHLLPPGLTALRIPSVRKMDVEFIKNMPKTVIDFEAGEESLPDTAVQYLSPDMTRLCLPANRTLTDAAIRQLPRHLTELNLNSNRHLSDDCVASIPRSVTILIIASATGISVLQLANFPPHLKELCLSNQLIRFMLDSHVPLLSRDLEKFSLTGARLLTANCIDDLPTKLRSRHWLPRELIQSLAFRFVAELPQTTTSTYGFPQWVKEYFCDEMVAHLPSSIATIEWPGASLSDAAFAAPFPSSLTILRLPVTSFISDQALAALPPNLTILTIPKCTQITDAGIAYLPSNLAVLDLSMNRRLTDFATAALPRSLTELYLQTNNTITDAGIANLPRSLKILGLGWNQHISDKGIFDLPPQLQDLDLGAASKITDESRNIFPKTLKRLVLNGGQLVTNLTRNALSHIVYLDIRH